MTIKPVVAPGFIPELSIVRLLRPVPDYGLSAGARGTVVHVYEGGGYEVEFAEGRGAGVVTLAPADVELIQLWS